MRPLRLLCIGGHSADAFDSAGPPSRSPARPIRAASSSGGGIVSRTRSVSEMTTSGPACPGSAPLLPLTTRRRRDHPPPARAWGFGIHHASTAQLVLEGIAAAGAVGADDPNPPAPGRPGLLHADGAPVPGRQAREPRRLGAGRRRRHHRRRRAQGPGTRRAPEPAVRRRLRPQDRGAGGRLDGPQRRRRLRRRVHRVPAVRRDPPAGGRG